MTILSLFRGLARFSRVSTAVLLGLAAALVIGLVEGSRAERASVEDLDQRILDRIYRPVGEARSQAQMLAANTDVREGVSERSRLTLKRALNPARDRMNVGYIGVLLPDGTPFFWVPDDQPRAPLVVAGRTPIEHELRTVAFLEYGSVLTDEFLGRLGSALSTELRLFSPNGRALAGASGVPPPAAALDEAPRSSPVSISVSGSLSRAVFTRGYGYTPLRAPDAQAGPVLAILGFRVPSHTAAATRIRRERNILWGLTAVFVIAIVAGDARARHRRPRPVPPFTPIPNPYIVGNPIRTADMFFGRDDDFQFARQKLTSERGGLVLVLCGERRSGKTSILFQILNGRLGDEFLPILIDMQYFAGIAGGRDRDFYRTVFGEIVRAVYSEVEQKGRLHQFDETPTDSPAQSFELVLNGALAAHPDRCFLFLFDEYEILEAKIDRGDLSLNVIPFLTGLLERNRRLAFIFTGSSNLEERASHHWRVMLGKSLYRKISYLTPADTERLVRRPVEGTVEYDLAAVARIYRLTSGQPFYTQVICQNLIDHLNEGRRRHIDPADLGAIVDGIVDNPLPQMIYFWDSLASEEKVALSLLAETLAADDAWAGAGSMLSEATRRGIPIDTDEATLEAALDRLFDKELLAKSPDRAFQYRIDLLRHWIRRTHSIWQVAKQARSPFDATA